MFIFLTGFCIEYQVPENEWKAPDTANSIQNPLTYSEKNNASAKKIFENLCWSCHGLNGKGTGPAAAAFVIKPADFSKNLVQQQSDGAIYWKISTGRGNMVSFREVLTSTQRWQLVSYIRMFKEDNGAGSENLKKHEN